MEYVIGRYSITAPPAVPTSQHRRPHPARAHRLRSRRSDGANPFASVTFAWLTVSVSLLVQFAFVGLFRYARAEARCFGAMLVLKRC